MRRILLKKNLFVLIIIATIAITLSLVSTYHSIQTSNEIRRIGTADIAANAANEAFDLSRIVENKIDSVTTNLQVLANAPSIQSGTSQDLAQLFDAAQYSTDDLTEYYMWLNPDGSINAASNIARASYQYNSLWRAEKPLFLTEPQKSGTTYYSNTIKSLSDDIRRLYIAYPIVYTLQQDKNSIGDFRGVIVASIRLDTLGRLLTNELSPAFDSDVTVVASSGEVVYSADKSAIGNNVLSDPLYLTRPFLSNFENDVKQKIADYIGSSNSANTGRLLSLSIDGKEITITSQPIDSNGYHFWTLYVITPNVLTDSVDALLTEQDALTMLTLLIIGSVSIGMAYLVVSWYKKLGDTVEKRTLELSKSNASLLDSYTKLESANNQLEAQTKLQREFVDIAAHELRTPIMPILGMTDLLESKYQQTDADQIILNKKDFEIISRNSRRLERLATDILDVSRIEAHSLHLNIESFDIYEVIQHTVNDIRNQFPNKKVEYVVQARSGLYLRADKSKIIQVLWNLLNNSAKFTDEGEIRITCQSERDHLNDRELIILSISDTGTGIDNDVLPRLFTKFTNKSGLDRNQGGSGLGLYISKGIVEAHGGKIRAENNSNGTGCTFLISLPISSSLLKTNP